MFSFLLSLVVEQFGLNIDSHFIFSFWTVADKKENQNKGQLIPSKIIAL